MKILIILRKFKGGVGRANIEIAKALGQKGQSVDFLSREDDLRIFSLSKSIFPIRKKVRELMAKNGYDVIYTQDYSCVLPLLVPFPIFWKRHFSAFCGVKKGTHPDYPWLQQKLNKVTHRLVGKLMGKKLIVIGNRLKEMFPKATLIYRGVNLKIFKPLNKKRTCVGWYHSDNEAIALKDLKDISKKTNLKLLVAKNLKKEEMNNFYNKCKVFINLPLSAGFNLSWLEAMSAEVPIIIGNYEGVGRVLPIEKIKSQENLVEEIIKIIKKSKKNSYRKWIVDNEFTWEKKSDELINFFEKNI